MPRKKKVTAVVDVEENCHGCVYFAEGNKNIGWCRRNPPQSIFGVDEMENPVIRGTSFSQTDPMWWCGEFKRRLNS